MAMNECRPFALPREVPCEEKAMPQQAMPKQEKRQGIVLDEQGQERPADKDRARKAIKTDTTKEDDELQPLREKSGF
jgi:hypothetical protein